MWIATSLETKEYETIYIKNSTIQKKENESHLSHIYNFKCCRHK